MSAPERIYLQDAGDYEGAAQFEVTWCVEPQDEKDTPYIRADLIRDAILAGMRIATLTSIEDVPRTIQEEIERIMGEVNE